MWKIKRLWKNNNDKREIKEIEYDKINREEYIIIDVRSRKEYLEQHLPGAINISLFNIKSEIKKIDQDNKKILLCCQSGIRSKRAASILEDMGYKEIYNLKGGIENI